MASEFKGTKGEWKNNCFLVVATSRPGGLYGGQEICHTGGGRCNSEEAEANAELIAEAGTVLHTTGKTPRELAGEVERLTTERDQARKAILSYGNGADFDWNVLGRIDDLERERDELVKVLGPLYAIARIKWGNLDPDANTILADAESLLARVNQPAAVTANENAGEPGE